MSACNTTMHCKIQYCLSLFNISGINYVTCCLRTQSSWCFLCFEFRHFAKQNPILLDIINLIFAQSAGYFIHLLSLLLQDGDIVSNPRVKNKKVNNLVTGMSIVHRLKIREAYNFFYSHDFICISETYLAFRDNLD